MTETLIAVVIPYYQRQSGLLAAAVASVTAQQIGAGVKIEIIIVDDGSPSPASAEEFPELPDWCRIRTIEQANRGISAARNAALDAVPANTDYVAFLDSDDVWAPSHLAMAIEAFNNGADIYFDNSYFDAGESYFDKLDFLKNIQLIVDLDNPKTYYRGGQEFFLASLLETVPHTSQAVFRFSNCPKLRFEEEIKTSGEDRLFFAELAREARKVGFHTGIMGSRGRGVSVYRSRLGWNIAALERTVDEIKCRKLILDRLDPPNPARNEIKRTKEYYYDHSIFLSVRNLRSDALAVCRNLYSIVAADPSFILCIPKSLSRLSIHRKKLLEAEAVRVGQHSDLQS